MTTGTFVSFVQDQLADLPALRVRRMFGGHGLYLDDAFFGIIAAERLYFRTNERSRAKYLAAGMGVFQPSERQTLKNYCEVPAEIVEDGARLREWAREAAALKG